MIQRIFLNIGLFLIVLVCPWWVSIIAALVLLYYFKTFTEIVIFGLIIDILYGHFSPGFQLFDYRATLVAMILLLISIFLKKRLKFYRK